jgi:hypothetical protein
VTAAHGETVTNQGDEGRELALAALDTALSDGPTTDGTTFTELDADQRSAVAGPRRSGILADGAMVSMLLGDYNLPDNEAAMTAWCEAETDREPDSTPGSRA